MNEPICRSSAKIDPRGVFATVVEPSRPCGVEWCGLPYRDGRVPGDAELTVGCTSAMTPAFCTRECRDRAGPSVVAPLTAHEKERLRVLAAPVGEKGALYPGIQGNIYDDARKACDRLAETHFGARCHVRCFTARRHVEEPVAKVREWKASRDGGSRDSWHTLNSHDSREASAAWFSQVAALPTYSRAPWLEPRWRRDAEYVVVVDNTVPGDG